MRAVFFDVGETLIDEARMWHGWARYLGVSCAAFLAELDRVIQRDEDHLQVFEHFRPGFDVDAARRDRAAAGDPDVFAAGDLYPDALPCLQELRDRGLMVGIAGNQPKDAEAALRRLGFEADVIASSAGWGVAKPGRAFFDRIADAAGLPAGEVAYVGDRLDNDVIPALEAGMVAVLLERGPWGRVHARRPDAARAHIVLRSLDGLVQRLNRQGGPSS